MYGFAVKNNHIFIADGGDFSANSKAYVYSLNRSINKRIHSRSSLSQTDFILMINKQQFYNKVNTVVGLIVMWYFYGLINVLGNCFFE